MIKSLLMEFGGSLFVVAIPAAVCYGGYRVAGRMKDPAWILAFLASLAAIAGMIGWQATRLTDNLPGNDAIDPTGVSYAIFVLFAIALTLNARTVWRAHKEQQSERNDQEGSTRRRLREAIHRKGGGKEAIEEALDEVDAELDAFDETPRLIKKMLPTLGLLGTVIGLAMSMSALGEALSAAISDQGGGSDQLMAAMQKALSGMGGAFITTLLGAGLGMLLMVLTSRTRWLLNGLLVEAKRRLEDERLESPKRQPRRRIDPEMN